MKSSLSTTFCLLYQHSILFPGADLGILQTNKSAPPVLVVTLAWAFAMEQSGLIESHMRLSSSVKH
jgi:hypothetical protein